MYNARVQGQRAPPFKQGLTNHPFSNPDQLEVTAWVLWWKVPAHAEGHGLFVRTDEVQDQSHWQSQGSRGGYWTAAADWVLASPIFSQRNGHNNRDWVPFYLILFFFFWVLLQVKVGKHDNEMVSKTSPKIRHLSFELRNWGRWCTCEEMLTWLAAPIDCAALKCSVRCKADNQGSSNCRDKKPDLTRTTYRAN